MSDQSQTHEYAFFVNMVAAIHVTAASEPEARTLADRVARTDVFEPLLTQLRTSDADVLGYKVDDLFEVDGVVVAPSRRDPGGTGCGLEGLRYPLGQHVKKIRRKSIGYRRQNGEVS